tara:strand:- start:6184 stop:6330 length:147 start_codon:yes stop_codon:yes gene_type:complete
MIHQTSNINKENKKSSAITSHNLENELNLSEWEIATEDDLLSEEFEIY